MIEKSKRRGYKKKTKIDIASEPVARKRGRPKGAKSKPKQPIAHTEPVAVEVRKRGRPKGAKNKPKAIAPAMVIKVKAKPAPEEIRVNKKVEQVDEHPLFAAVKWLEKHMHPSQSAYYAKRAARAGATLHNAMLADILGFFNVQETNILKQVKKNNFIATFADNELH
jgi:hypothetical protein